jgi:hypothetical protein
MTYTTAASDVHTLQQIISVRYTLLLVSAAIVKLGPSFRSVLLWVLYWVNTVLDIVL